MLELNRKQFAGCGMTAQKHFWRGILLVQRLIILFPVGTKIADSTEAFNQCLIPRLTLGEPIALLKELNAARYPSLPGFDCLVIEGRTHSHREVGMKKEMEEMSLWLQYRTV